MATLSTVTDPTNQTTSTTPATLTTLTTPTTKTNLTTLLTTLTDLARPPYNVWKQWSGVTSCKRFSQFAKKSSGRTFCLKVGRKDNLHRFQQNRLEWQLANFANNLSGPIIKKKKQLIVLTSHWVAASNARYSRNRCCRHLRSSQDKLIATTSEKLSCARNNHKSCTPGLSEISKIV